MSALGTFFGWRGAHHGKATSRAVSAQSAQQLGIERARWRADYPTLAYPYELMTPAERVRAEIAGSRVANEPWPPWTPGVWWTLLVLAVLLGLTVIGLPFTAIVGYALWVRSPYREPAVAYDHDPPTAPMVTVPDPVQTYRLPATAGRHAR